MGTNLSSTQISRAAYGCFTHILLAASFDAILPTFVKRTFEWNYIDAGLIFFAITIPSTLGAAIGALSARYGPRYLALCGFIITTPSLALMGLAKDDSMGSKVLLCVLLVMIGHRGCPNRTIRGPMLICRMRWSQSDPRLVAGIFQEVEALAEENPGMFGKIGAFAQAYSLVDAALGFSTVIGPGWSGLFIEKAGWPITVGSLAVLCAARGVPAFFYTGGSTNSKTWNKGHFSHASKARILQDVVARADAFVVKIKRASL